MINHRPIMGEGAPRAWHETTVSCAAWSASCSTSTCSALSCNLQGGVGLRASLVLCKLRQLIPNASGMDKLNCTTYYYSTAFGGQGC